MILEKYKKVNISGKPNIKYLAITKAYVNNHKV